MKAAFLDRDGVINADRDDYVKNVAELDIYPFAPHAIRRLNEAGYEVAVISNQQGVAKGLISEADLEAIETEIRRRVEAEGARIQAFYYCRHLDAEKCGCRKPEPGLILKAASDLDIDLAASVFIGDSERDIVAGRRAGCGRTILVLTGKLNREDASRLNCLPDVVAEDLREAADLLTGRGTASKD